MRVLRVGLTLTVAPALSPVLPNPMLTFAAGGGTGSDLIPHAVTAARIIKTQMYFMTTPLSNE